MKRIALAVTAIGILVTPAEAAGLFHPSKVEKTVEKGVTVWRGREHARIAAPALKPAACLQATIVIKQVGWPPRRLRTHGFWSGRTPGVAAYPLVTTGFYADRIAAGY
ncbi:MAG: hypothetical protein AB7F91_09115 [Parvularculaceae bacterium]|nr:hypothetical protein [Parvularculaceae bacterium]